jgi:hypothetical protein
MTNFNFARVLVGVAGAAVLTTLTLAGAGSASAHGMGGHLGGMTGIVNHNLNLVQTSGKIGDRDRFRRHFRFVDVGYAGLTTGCFWQRTAWGNFIKVCPDLY